MSNKIKNILYTVGVLLFMGLVWLIRQDKKTYSEIHGETMGTSYTVKYSAQVDYKDSIDSLLVALNNSVSTYIDDSEISRFNTGTMHKMESPFFFPILSKSKEVFASTGGAFDPTVMPLVRAWGFGPGKATHPDSLEVKQLKQLVGMDSVFFDSISICKLKNEIQLDFSALAKGYGVDLVYEFLEAEGIENIFIEIGGECRATGLNPDGKTWRVGVENPKEVINPGLYTAVELDGKAIATSGNYRNFYVKDGIKYAHTISPFTGYPVEHTLLSASVFAKDCMTADAYATAFMVMGKDKSMALLETHPELEVILIFGSENGGIKSFQSETLELLY